jgi:undecaprenyl-diphosphatase
MNWLHALILGLVQGLTEFFPISSSTHLQILSHMMGVPDTEQTAFFHLACHVGTVCVLILYFRKDLKNLLFVQPKKILFYVVALVPLIPFYILLHPLKQMIAQGPIGNSLLVVTAAFLFCAAYIARKRTVDYTLSYKDSFWIGIAQSFALLPGISRSGSTMLAGLWRGLTSAQTVQFSFLLSIPTFLIASLFELLKLMKYSSPIDYTLCSIGFFSSFGMGLLMIQIAIPLLSRAYFKPFAWYCLIAAILLRLL